MLVRHFLKYKYNKLTYVLNAIMRYRTGATAKACTMLLSIVALQAFIVSKACLKWTSRAPQ